MFGICKKLALGLLVMVWPFVVWADFSGAYAPANWTTTMVGTPPGGGSTVDTAGAPASITIVGGNSACLVQPCYVDFTIAAPASGNVSFHWDYATTDVGGPQFELFLILNNGASVQLSNNGGANSQSGDYSMPVNAGQVFGFRLDCVDCDLGAATVTISNFVAPAGAAGPAVQSVPTLQEWTLLSLMALMGLIGFGQLRRQRRN